MSAEWRPGFGNIDPEGMLLRKKMIFNVCESENIAGFPNTMNLYLHREYKEYTLQ
jgi:hypothetical protein